MNLDWVATEAKAKRMSDDSLLYAASDAVSAAMALNGAEVKGKDYGYYMDEASVYQQELERRHRGRKRVRS